MKVRVGPIGNHMSVKCPKCGRNRYIKDGTTVEKCWFCADAEFEVDIRPINRYGACEAIPREK
jgi:transposase-like protein